VAVTTQRTAKEEMLLLAGRRAPLPDVAVMGETSMPVSTGFRVFWA